MSAPVFQIEFTQDIKKPVLVQHCGNVVFTGDNLSDTISVSVLEDGEPYAISGTVAMNCIRADGATVTVTGSVSGNTASATLTQACVAIPGPLAVVIKVTSDTTTTTLLKAVYMVDVGVTGTAVDPGTIIPDVTTLINAIETAVGSIPADYSDLLATIAPNFVSGTYNKDKYVWNNGTLYRFTDDHSGSWTGTDVESVVIGDELTNLKSATEQLTSATPSIKDSEYEGADLDVSDSSGNVIVRFQGGDVKTKNFDSQKMTQIKNQMEDNDADLYLVDKVGNGIIRFANGQLQTKGFNSDQSIFKQTFSYTNVSGTETIAHYFPCGTSILLHLVNNAAVGSDSIANNKVTYSYIDRNNVSHEIGQEYGYNFLKYVFPSDAVSVSVTYGGGMLWGSSGTLAFSIIVEATFKRETVVVTVDASGGRDYTSLRAAIEAVNTKASEATPYEIHIYPGTYNVLSDYSADEISASGFYGLMITNGISLIGIGQREQIIIQGVVSAETYNATKRNDISTLNVQGNVRIENLTITAENIRYAIHDDYVTMTYRISDNHVYKNLKLYGTNLTTGEITFGAGGNGRRTLKVSDCDFNGTFLVHNSANNTVSYQVYVENCSATKFSFPDYDAVTPTYVYLRNCKAMFIEEGIVGDTHNQSLFIEGEGTCGAFIKCPAGYVYNTGDCRRIHAAQIDSGYAVKAARIGYHGSYPHIAVATDIESIYGISLGNDGSDTIVQVSGYISSNTLGLTGLAIGDYLTIDSSGAIVSGGTASNAVAKVVFVDENSIAYAKLIF